jgi:energy-coupling factor transporter ATP-binding protein EcfA2
MVRLASIEFTKLKNVRSGTRLTFPKSGAVLLGKNGTGKTTLLQYLVALCTADLSAFVSNEPFDVSATFIFDTGARATLRLEGTPSTSLPLPRELSDIARYLPASESTKLELVIVPPDQDVKYRIIIVDNRAELYCNDQPLCTPFPVTNPQYQLANCAFRLSDLIAEPKNSPLSSKASVFAAAFELIKLQGALCRYDEGLDYFRMLTDENSSYLSLEIVVSAVAEPSVQHVRGTIYRVPSSLLDALTHKWPATSESESFSAKHAGIDFLTDFVRLCKFSGATAIAPIDARRVVNDTSVSNQCKSLRFVFELGKDSFSHTSLSFGQKRFLGYLYYLGCNTQIGIADELVNGMHHEWIEHCLDAACIDRQMFYTSQNPLLLDFLVFESDAEVSERFVTCKLNEEGGFVWENFDANTGSEFYRLYKAGIQHVSDILRTKGWW